MIGTGIARGLGAKVHYSVWIKIMENDEQDGYYPFLSFHGSDREEAQPRSLELIEMLEDAPTG